MLRQSIKSNKSELEKQEPTSETIAAKHQQEKSKNLETPMMAATSASANASGAILKVYQELLPKNPDVIAFLFGSSLSDALQDSANRIAIQQNFTKEVVIEEFRRFLAIKVFIVDGDADKISPTPIMDEIWLAAILNTCFYADLQSVLGPFLHYRPVGASEQESEQWKKRLAIMKSIYREFFLMEPLKSTEPRLAHPTYPQATHPSLAKPLSGRISIFVKTLDNEIVPFVVKKQATLGDVKSTIYDRKGIPPDQQRLVYMGEYPEDDRTLEDYRIHEDSKIHLVVRVAAGGSGKCVAAPKM